MDKKLIWLKYFGCMLMGMYVISAGSIMVDMREMFSLSMSEGGIILSLFSGAYLVMGFIAGFLLDKFGSKVLSISAGLVFALSPLLIIFAQSSIHLYLGFTLLGCGWGLMNTELNVVVTTLTKGDSRALGILHMTFGIGAFVFPLLLTYTKGFGLTYHYSIGLLALLSLVYSVLAFFVEVPSIKRDIVEEQIKFSSVYAPILIFMSVLFFYVGSESTFNGWVVTVLTNSKGLSEVLSQQLLSLYWFLMIVGRLLVAILVKPKDIGNSLFFISITSVIAMLVFTFSNQSLLIIASVIVLGLALAGVYPLMMAFAHGTTKGSGMITAILISGGGLGSSVLPFLAGVLGDGVGTSSIMVLMIITLSIMTGFAFLSKKYQA